MAPGWTMVPSVLMQHQRELGLNSVQFNILMQLAKRWWKNEPPFVSKRTIAHAMGVSMRTVQRQLTALEKQGLIRREERRRQDGGRSTNSYVFTGLIQKAKPYAAKMLEERERRLAERAARRKPKLELVKS